jgi:phosphate uptake regulator
MIRRLIKQGHNTLTVTLPSKWIQNFGLGAGSEVDLSERENGLFITTQKINTKKKAEFDITDMDIPTVWKYFMAVYREGYDEIKVKFTQGAEIESPYKFFAQHRVDLKYKKEREKKSVLEVLHGFVTRFIGFEIVEHGKDYILIKEMGELTNREFDNALRRVFLLVQQMSDETVEAIKSSNPKILGHMHDVDISLDRFHDYCIRILNKNHSKEPRKTNLLFSTLYLLELLGDEFKNISIHLSEDFPKTKFKNIEHFADAIKEEIDLFYDLYYTFDMAKIQKISEADKKYYFSYSDIFKKSGDEEKEIFHHLRLIGRYINALVELRIEMEF